VYDLGVDLLSASGHKFYGPKGVGFLYVKEGTRIHSFIHGGMQERRLRASTHNVPAIVGMAEAVSLAEPLMEEDAKRLTGLREFFVSGLNDSVEGIKLNGHPDDRLPGNVNICFEETSAEAAALYLDNLGIACSTGSACDTASIEPSHVLMAIGLSRELALGSLRFSLGRKTEKQDIEYVLEVLPGVVDSLRSLASPGYETAR
jgi:cysteine desulfurase